MPKKNATDSSICIIGNGCVLIDSDGRQWINNRLGDFLVGLCDSGYNVTYLDVEKRAEKSALLNFEIGKNRNISVLTIRNSSFVASCWDLFRFFKDANRFDFIYIFFPGKIGRIVSRYLRFTGIRYGLYLRGQYFTELGRDRSVFRNARLVLAVSPQLLDRIEPVANGVLKRIQPMTDITTVAPSEFTNCEHKKFLYVGRLEIAKGVLELVEAACDWSQAGMQYELRIVGSGPLEQELRERSLPPEITLVGQIDDQETLNNEYAAADVFLFPTHHEGFPRSLVEAMSHGLLIFTTMVGGIPGVMTPDHNCFEIPVRDAKALSAIVKDRIQHDCDLHEVRNNAVKTIRNIVTSYNVHHVELIEYLEQC